MITMEDIIREGHPTLREVSEEIKLPLDEENIKLGHEMLTFLKNSQNEKIAERYNLRGGVGLAAPQLDIKKRMIALHIPNQEIDEEGNIIEYEPILSEVMVNPKIISESVKKSCLPGGEGCLSVDREVPGYVPRATRITVKYTDLEGNAQEIRLNGYPAIVVQHEIDHLNGVLFYDYIKEDNPYQLEDGVSVLDE